MKSYTYSDVRATSVDYFKNDELAADVFVDIKTNNLTLVRVTEMQLKRCEINL